MNEVLCNVVVWLFTLSTQSGRQYFSRFLPRSAVIDCLFPSYQFVSIACFRRINRFYLLSRLNHRADNLLLHISNLANQ